MCGMCVGLTDQSVLPFKSCCSGVGLMNFAV